MCSINSRCSPTIGTNCSVCIMQLAGCCLWYHRTRSIVVSLDVLLSQCPEICKTVIKILILSTRTWQKMWAGKGVEHVFHSYLCKLALVLYSVHTGQ